MSESLAIGVTVMPLDGDKLDELLSGYLDGQLTAEERELIEGCLQGDVKVSERLEEFRSLQAELHTLRDWVRGRTPQEQAAHEQAAQAQSTPRVTTFGRTGASLPADFSDRVIELARRQAEAENLLPSHHVRVAEFSPPISGQAASPTDSRTRPGDGERRGPAITTLVATLLGTAAVIGLAIYVPSLWWKPDGNAGDGLLVDSSENTAPERKNEDSEALLQEPAPELRKGAPMTSDNFASNAEQSTNRPLDGEANEPTADEQSPRYVGDRGFQTQFVMVVDVQPTAEAVENDLFDMLLDSHGITLAEPIVGDADLAEALSQSRMTVQGGTDAESDQALLYFVHADINAIGQALDGVYTDIRNFPQVRFDLVFDSPTTGLFERIAARTGKRFAIDEGFAAPIAFSESDSAPPTPLPGLAPQGKLVSNDMRRQGAGSSGLASLGSDQTCVLFLVRLPE